MIYIYYHLLKILFKTNFFYFFKLIIDSKFNIYLHFPLLFNLNHFLLIMKFIEFILIYYFILKFLN